MKNDEKLLEKGCSRYARRQGFAVVKLEKNGNKGIPDIAVIAQGGRTLYIEFKTETGTPSEEQIFWKNYLGNSCQIIRSFDDFRLILKAHYML